MTHPAFLSRPALVQVDLRTDCAGYGDTVRLFDHFDPYRLQIAALGTQLDFSSTHPVAPFAKGELAADVATAFFSRARKAKTLRGGQQLPHKVIVGNCAPREEGTKNAHGCPFVLAVLPGLTYIGTAWSELSFVKQHVQALFAIDVPNEGTQYRSQYLGDALGRFLTGDRSLLVTTLDVSAIPDPNYETVARVDAMGNINLNLPENHALFSGRVPGETLRIFINREPHSVIYCAGIGGAGAAKVGDLVLVPGSLTYSLDPKGPRNMDIQYVIGEGHRGAAAASFRSARGVQMRNGIPVGGDSVSLVWARSVDELVAAARV